MTEQRADYDNPWKEALSLYFQPFMAFFFPDIHANIDWSRDYEFLDKEFQQIVRDAEIGRREADKLVKVWQSDGEETWLLIHRPPILKPDESYTFRSYFQMRFAPADILRELGATLIRASIDLPIDTSIRLPRLPDLRQRLEEGITRVSLTSEAARREVLIAPILLEIANITEATVNIEYPIEVNQYLRGDLDYYLQSQHNILVVEAKQADLTRGFTQLATELIALDSWVELDDKYLYGAVTTGDIWQFGSFHRQQRVITQDKNALSSSY